MKISVIIPIYNEEKIIIDCLSSLVQQTANAEIIVVDDGSNDNSKFKIQNSKLQFKNKKLTVLEQEHKGSGAARNFGVSRATGEILVFVDADMTFAPDFLEKLTSPIIGGETKGTFTKEEFVSNWDNVWARCWNYNQGIGAKLRIPENYPETAPVFRAILKSEFAKVGGFANIGFTDDWTLSRKLGYQSSVAVGAICYHRNPETLTEVYRQARWIGKNEFLTGTLLRKIRSYICHDFFYATIRGIFLAVRYAEPRMVIFCWVYSWGIYVSVIKSFWVEAKSK